MSFLGMIESLPQHYSGLTKITDFFAVLPVASFLIRYRVPPHLLSEKTLDICQSVTINPPLRTPDVPDVFAARSTALSLRM